MKDKPYITIAQIAKIAGVGQATVSRVINNSGYVKATTREKIERIIQELEYVPSEVARSLSKNQSRIVALIIPQLANPFYMGIINGISSVFEKAGYLLVVHDTTNKTQTDVRAIEAMVRQRVAGIIYTPSNKVKGDDLRKLQQLLADGRIPQVLLDRPLLANINEFDLVVSNNFEDSYTATKALIDAGHSRIGVMICNKNEYVMGERYRGYCCALKDGGIVYTEDDFLHVDTSTLDQAYELSKAFLLRQDRPTAIFCGNNICSIGFLRAAFELGIKIPDDIAYIGYDALPSLDVLGYTYTYMDRDLNKIGKEAAKLLLKRIESPDKPHELISIPATLRSYGSERYIGSKK